MNEKKGNLIKTFRDSFVIVDIETTGFYPNTDDIIEIGAMKVDENGEITTFETLIHTNKQLSSFITNLTGITNEMLAAEGQDIADCLQQFDTFVEDYPIMGHNVNFDLRFLRYTYKKYLQKDLVNDYMDTLYYARKYLPFLPNHKLNTVADYFHVDSSKHHRALADVIMTLEIYNQITQINSF